MNIKSADKDGKFFAIKLSFTFGVVMLLIKWYAYYITNSSAILSDAAESIVHIIGVAFAVYSLWLSLQPADKSHTYGHDKISYFSAGIEGGLIIIAAAYIIFVSAQRLVIGVEVTNLDKGAYFTFGASVLNLFLGSFLVWRGKKTKSLILIANGKHVLTDSWTSFGVVAGLLLTWLTGWLPFDPIIAIIAALNILWTGSKLIRQAAGGLMDESDENVGKEIIKILEERKSRSQIDYHELRYRTSGEAIWIDVHLLFPDEIKLTEAHKAATEIENEIQNKFKEKVNITTHMEPIEMHKEIHK